MPMARPFSRHALKCSAKTRIDQQKEMLARCVATNRFVSLDRPALVRLAFIMQLTKMNRQSFGCSAFTPEAKDTEPKTSMLREND
jgi:hypothetical protein